MKTFRFVTLIALAVFLPLALSGCSPKEVTEEEIISSINEYIPEKGGNVRATDVVIGDYNIDEDYEILNCDITLATEIAGESAAVSVPFTLQYCYYDEGGWQLYEVEKQGPDAWNWVCYPDAESMKSDAAIVLYTSDLPIMDEYLTVDESSPENYDFASDKIAYNYYFEYTDCKYADVAGNIVSVLYFRENEFLIDTEYFNDGIQAKWKNIDGTWKASWESEDFGEKTILITIEGDEITDVSTSDSVGTDYSDWGADDLTFGCPNYPYSDYEGDLTLKVDFSVDRGQFPLSDYELFNLCFSSDEAYLRLDSDSAWSTSKKSELQDTVVSDLVKQ